ncbi:MAG: hypothetical protein JF607_09755 [Burkholderiales bacterium]|nr:hypothetical protein [Burkholderiales bacterium]
MSANCSVQQLAAGADLRDAQRPDRVPDSDGGDADAGAPRRVAGAGAEEAGQRGQHILQLGQQRRVAVQCAAAVVAPGRGAQAVGGLLVLQVGEGRVKQALRGDHAGQRAHRVGAAAEADQVDAVARLIVARHEGVAADDARDQPGADRAAQCLDEGVVRVAHAVQVLGRLQNLARRVGQEALLLVGQRDRVQRIDAGQVVEELEHIGRRSGLFLVAAAAIPGAVGTKHDLLGHVASGGGIKPQG